VGFEPTRACALPVFKTGAINHSTTPPRYRVAGDFATTRPMSNRRASVGSDGVVEGVSVKRRLKGTGVRHGRPYNFVVRRDAFIFSVDRSDKAGRRHSLNGATLRGAASVGAWSRATCRLDGASPYRIGRKRLRIYMFA
jgi:hypothetical protein